MNVQLKSVIKLSFLGLMYVSKIVTVHKIKKNITEKQTIIISNCIILFICSNFHDALISKMNYNVIVDSVLVDQMTFTK